MIQKWVNFLQGNVKVEVTGAFPERFLNLCAQAGIGFWELNYAQEHCLQLKVAGRDVRKLEPLAQKAMCELKVNGRIGLPFFLARFRRRYALFIGVIISLGVIAVLSQFILTVDVQGNERVPSRVILEKMKQLGVYPGVYGPTIDERQVSNEALLELEDLAWISVNLHGTRAEILVRERTLKPEVVDEYVPAHVVAGTAGIITYMEVLSGEAKFQKGDTVVEGDIIISGVVDLKEPLYSEGDMGTLTVRAAGSVYARTWRTLQAVIPLQAEIKGYTGNEVTRWSLTFLGHRLQFYKNGGISYDRYDKIKDNYTLTLRKERELPLTLTRETVREFDLQKTQINVQSGEEMLCAQLEERLRETIRSTEGEVLQTSVSSVQHDGLLAVTLVAECREQIGQIKEFQGVVGRSEGAAEP